MPTVDEVLGGTTTTTPPKKTFTVDDILRALGSAGEVAEVVKRGNFSDETLRAVQTASEQSALPEGTSVLPLLLSTAGGLAGRRAGGPFGEAAGAGAGAMAGEALNPAVMPRLGLKAPAAPSLFDLAKTGGLTALFDLAAQAGIAGAKRIPGVSARPDARRILEAFGETGVTPKVTDVSGSRLPAMVEQGAAQTLGGQEVKETVERQSQQLFRSVDDFKAKVGKAGAESPTAVGTAIKDTVDAQYHRVKEVENHLWQELRGMATDTPVGITALKRLADETERQQLQLLPSQRSKKLLTLAKEIQDEPATTRWQRVDEWRRQFGESVGQSEMFTGVSRNQSERFYAAALQDMERAAATVDIPGLGVVYKNVREFGAKARQLFKDSEVGRLLETDPEKVVEVLNLAGGPSALARAREAILGSGRLGQVAPTPEALETWNFLRRHLLEGAFKTALEENAPGAIGARLSAPRLERALGKLGRDTLNELLDATERRALENIQIVTKAIRSSERAAATGFTSVTAQMGEMVALFAAPGAIVGGALGGPIGAAVGGALSLLVTPAPAAKLLTSPSAAAFLASPRFAAAARGMEQVGRVTGEGARALMRLGAITMAEEDREARRRR